MIACLFDIDGTLLASGGAGKAALELAFTEEFGVALGVQIPYSGRTDRAIARDLLRLHNVDDTPANWQKLQAGYLARLPASLNRHNGRVLPGILALLKELQGRDDVAQRGAAQRPVDRPGHQHLGPDHEGAVGAGRPRRHGATTTSGVEGCVMAAR